VSQSIKKNLFFYLLKKWGHKINLMSRAQLHEKLEENYADSQQLASYLKDESAIVDVGSGGGFPGIVLAIECHPYLRIHLVESDTRKAFFLEEVVRQLGLNATVYPTRIEDIPQGAFSTHTFTSRALSSLSDGLQLLSTHLTPKTRYLTLKGARAQNEVHKARQAWDFDIAVYPSLTHPEGKILDISNIRHLS
jgi:16S rRNA (guanine527-N7)-methyltransferase